MENARFVAPSTSCVAVQDSLAKTCLASLAKTGPASLAVTSRLASLAMTKRLAKTGKSLAKTFEGFLKNNPRQNQRTENARFVAPSKSSKPLPPPVVGVPSMF